MPSLEITANFSRISNRCAPDLGKGSKRMNLAASCTHDVLCADSPNQQRIGDERTMTTPRHRFGTHDRNLFLLCQLDQFFEARLKFRRPHIIRITSKGSIAPEFETS